jgi:DNA-binding NarL/FixJ family response regulator
VTRVLLGDFEALARLGFRDVFRQSDLELLEAHTTEILQRLLESLPDVVLLDLDKDGVVELAHQIASEFPAVKVIACSSATPTMRIFPPFHRGESYRSQLDPARLTRAVRA